MIDNYKDKLKSTLSEKRYKHSLGVCDEAVKLAEYLRDLGYMPKSTVQTPKRHIQPEFCTIVQRVMTQTNR
mgnify:CR=1 FL=1